MELPQTVQTQMSAGLQDALVKLHANAVIIEEDGNGNYSKYATYENIIKTVRPLMGEQDLFFQHISHPAQGGAAVETVIYGHGGWLSSGIVRIPASKQDEHKYGAAITYAKRYSLMLALGLGGDEDPISDLPTEKLPTVVEAKEQAAPKKAPARKTPAKKEEASADQQRSVCWKEAGVADSQTPEEARERFKAYAKGCRNRKLDPLPDVFERWLVNNFGEQKNV